MDDVESAPRASRFITVSATYGSGGSVIAPLLAHRVGLPFADRLIAARDAPAAQSSESVTQAELDQEPRRSFFARLAQMNSGLNFPVPRDPEDLRDHVRERVEQSFKELSRQGGAVVLGRAGQLVLARHPRAFHVRLDGPQERRAHRGAMWEGIDLEIARARMVETDEARVRYIRRLYQCDPSDASLYHVVLDATALGAEACAEFLAGAAEAFWQRDDSRLEQTIAQTRALLASLHIDTKP